MLNDPNVSHALIVFVITVLQSVWLRRMKRETSDIYKAVNSGRMERIENDLAVVKAAIAKDSEASPCPASGPRPSGSAT